MAEQAGDRAPTIIDAAQHAFVDGWVQSMWIGVGLAAVALAYLVIRGPVRVTDTGNDVELDAALEPAAG